MKKVEIKLSELVNPPKTDSISGREFGEDYAKKIKLVQLFEQEVIVDVVIDDSVIKAINDSFIKGLFSSVFKKYKTIANVKKHVSINANEYFKRLFEKNWMILQEINNV